MNENRRIEGRKRFGDGIAYGVGLAMGGLLNYGMYLCIANDARLIDVFTHYFVLIPIISVMMALIMLAVLVRLRKRQRSQSSKARRLSNHRSVMKL